MHIEQFKASVQYGDFSGTVAADGADKGDASDWLKTKGIQQEGEFLVGVTLYVGENHGNHKDPVCVEFLLATSGDHDNFKSMLEAHSGPVVVRRVKAEMPIAEFFGMYKRFSVHVSPHGMLEGREYTYPDY